MESDAERSNITASLEYYKQDYPFGISKEIFNLATPNIKTEVKQGQPKLSDFFFLMDINAEDFQFSASRQFLDQIIEKGLKLKLGTYQIIESTKFKIEDLKFCSRLLVVFGSNNFTSLFPAADFQESCNKVIDQNGIKILVTERLVDIQNNPVLKKQFWEVLKNYA